MYVAALMDYITATGHELCAVEHAEVHGCPVLYRQHQPSMAIGKLLSMPAYKCMMYNN